MQGASAIINLVGIFKGDLDQVHVEGARRAAAAAKSAGAGAFVRNCTHKTTGRLDSLQCRLTDSVQLRRTQ